MSIPHFVICFLLVIANCLPTVAAETPLVWKFQAGDEHHYRMSQSMEMDMTLGTSDREIKTGMTQVIDMTWKIEAVDDQGIATLEQTVDRVQMDMDAPGRQKMHFDTDSDESPSGFAAMLAPLFKAMTAEPSQMTITPRGKIQNFEMPESLAKAMKALPGAAAMGEMFSDEGFRNMIQQSSLILPEPKDLNPGYEWTTKTEIENPQFGTMEITTTYSYLGSREVKGKPYEAFGITLQMDFGEGPGGIKMDIVSHESEGVILFSRETGRLESSKMQQDMRMNISTGKQEIVQKMVQTVTFERVEQPQTEQE